MRPELPIDPDLAAGYYVSRIDHSGGVHVITVVADLNIKDVGKLVQYRSVSDACDIVFFNLDCIDGAKDGRQAFLSGQEGRYGLLASFAAVRLYPEPLT